MKLTRNLAEEYVEAKKVFHNIESEIEDRITEVFRILCKHFNAKFGSWWYPNCTKYSDGYLTADILSDEACIEFEWCGDGLTSVANFLDPYCGLPVFLLFMDDGDIISWVQKEVATKEEKQKKKRASVKKTKEKKDELKKSAMSKLTKEEAKALKGND